VVIPAFNEAVRIKSTLCALGAELATNPFHSEKCVMDDGSENDTVKVVETAGRADPTRVAGGAAR
jgi:hypothetical protein